MRHRSGLAGFLLILLACGGSGGSGGSGGAAPSGAAGGNSTPTVTPEAPHPVLFVHGINGQPANWLPTVNRLARGRTVHAPLFAGDADRLAPDSLAPDSLFVVGYYREEAGSPRFYSDRWPELPSIGGCPEPRTDPYAADYTISYVDQLDRIVEGVCRATGSERIDLVGFSMGGIVSRAYVRWRSVRATGSRSRVRRLLTLGTPNHGINSLEATMVALTQVPGRAHVEQGEAAELNYECRYWGGRSFIERLNDGWDGFCQQHDVRHGNAWAFGTSTLNRPPVQFLQQMMTWLTGPITHSLLVHPTPGYAYPQELAEASGDGDGVVRVGSARMDQGAYPHVLFNLAYYGLHGDDQLPERGLNTSTFAEALIRRFVIEGETAPAFSVLQADLRQLDLPGTATWLRLEVETTGQPLMAQVLAWPIGSGPLEGDARAWGLLLHPGEQRIDVPLTGLSGPVEVAVRLYGTGGREELPLLPAALHPGQPPLLARPHLGLPSQRLDGGWDIPVTTGLAGSELKWELAAPAAGGFGPWLAADRVTLPVLPAGLYELRVRARAPLKQDSAEPGRPAAVRLEVDGAGSLQLSR